MFSLDLRIGKYHFDIHRCHSQDTPSFDEEDMLDLFFRARNGEDPIILMAEMFASVGEI